jgi:hypothetical protein
MYADKKSSQTQIAQATLDEVNQSVRITIASGTITIPPGLATEAKQDTQIARLDTLITQTDGVEGSLTSIDGKLATLGQKTSVGSLPVVIASDQSAVLAAQSGTWNINNISGSVSLPSGAATEAKQDATITQVTRLNAVHLARNDYTVTSVTTAAYVQLVASMPAAVKEVEIFDSSGQTLVLAIGGAGSEVNKVYVFPGGNGRIPLQIASTARLSIKAVSGTANSGEISVNFYG